MPDRARTIGLEEFIRLNQLRFEAASAAEAPPRRGYTATEVSMLEWAGALRMELERREQERDLRLAQARLERETMRNMARSWEAGYLLNTIRGEARVRSTVTPEFRLFERGGRFPFDQPPKRVGFAAVQRNRKKFVRPLPG